MLFTYRALEFREPSSGWGLIAYTEIASKIAAFLLVQVYDCFRLWGIYLDMIASIKSLGLCRVFRYRANADEVERLLCVIERIDFPILPNDWSLRPERRIIGPGRRDWGANYLLCNLHNKRVIPYNEASALVCASPVRLLPVNTVGWDFEALDTYERENDGRITGMNNQVIGWDEEVAVVDKMRDASQVASDKRPVATRRN